MRVCRNVVKQFKILRPEKVFVKQGVVAPAGCVLCGALKGAEGLT